VSKPSDFLFACFEKKYQAELHAPFAKGSDGLHESAGAMSGGVRIGLKIRWKLRI
jgi:hypothetical protein